MQILWRPAAEYEMTRLRRRAVNAFKRGLRVSQNIDCYALQAIVCDVLKGLPNGDALAVQLKVPPTHYPDIVGVSHEPCQIVVFSDGEIVCVLEPFTHISVMHHNSHGWNRVRALVQITLRGTPNKPVRGHIDARQQMALMHRILATKLTATFDGYAYHHPQDTAGKIGDMVLEAKSELEHHFYFNTVTVKCGLSKNDQVPPERAEQEDVPISLADSPVCKGAVAIKALLQELDSKLLSITPSSPDDTIASGEVTRSVELDSGAKSNGQMQRGVVVALGSNVGNRVEEIEKACRAIDADPDMRIVDTSFLYETKPMYVEDQERFVNGACEVSGDQNPGECSARC